MTTDQGATRRRTTRGPTVPPPSAAQGPGLDLRDYPWVAQAAVLSRPDHSTGRWVLAADDLVYRAYDLRALGADEARRVRGDASLSLALGDQLAMVPTSAVTEKSGWLVVESPQSGRSLRDHLERVRDGAGPPRTPEEYSDLLGRVAEALDELHQREITHRAITPDNLVEHPTTGQLWLSNLSDARSEELRDDRYVAPEQFAGEVGPSVDQYALGLVAREVLAASGVAGLTIPVHEVLQRATSPHPRDRFASIGEFATALRHAVRVEAPRGSAGRVASWSPARRAALLPAGLGAAAAVVGGAEDARSTSSSLGLAILITVVAVVIFAGTAWGTTALAASIRGRRTRLSVPFAYGAPFTIFGCAIAVSAVVVAADGNPSPADFVWPMVGVFVVRALLAPAPEDAAAGLIRVLRYWDRRRFMSPVKRAALTCAFVGLALLLVFPTIVARQAWPTSPKPETTAAWDFGPLTVIWNLRMALAHGDYDYACTHALALPARADRAPCSELVRVASLVQRADAASQDPRDVFGSPRTQDTFRVQELPAPAGSRVWSILGPTGNRPLGSIYTQDSSAKRVVVMISRHPSTDRAVQLRSVWLYQLSYRGGQWSINGFRACRVGSPGTSQQAARCDITDITSRARVRAILRRANQGDR